jgi:hypothetical protein
MKTVNGTRKFRLTKLADDTLIMSGKEGKFLVDIDPRYKLDMELLKEIENAVQATVEKK